MRPSALSRFSLLAVAFLLASCNSDHPPSGPYAKWLENGEEVESTEQVGPFTVLHIRYRPSGWGSFHGTGHNLDRVLHAAKVVVEKSEISKPWEGTGAPAVLSYVYAGDKSPLHVVYERKGKPVVERIDGDRIGLTLGEPVGPGLRYFEVESGTHIGFLLKAFPLQVFAVPRGAEHSKFAYLAGLAPDFKAFALADSPATPTAVIVVDAQGKLGDPIPMPLMPGASREIAGDRPSELARAWFDSHFAWQKNAEGRWDIVRATTDAPGAATANPVEELFLDASMGYRTCFGGNAIACLRGWQKVPAEGKAMQDLFCCDTPYFYKPVQTVRAFGAPVRRLLYAPAAGGAAYHLILNAPPEQVMRELSARVERRGFRHLNHEQITEESIAGFVGKDFYRTGSLVPQNDASGAQQLVLPTVTLRVEAFEQGTIIYTLARYPALEGAGAAK
ncbi:hypothetical protein [Pseudoduganella sp.]|uniref:hypothetical protein n=1 Tax=Pseudoduganella sp. TaxID=1880898 RepID=UPI0035AE0404